MWDLLNDPEVLARITPGVDTLEQTGPGQYQAVLHIKMGTDQQYLQRRAASSR